MIRLHIKSATLSQTLPFGLKKFLLDAFKPVVLGEVVSVQDVEGKVALAFVFLAHEVAGVESDISMNNISHMQLIKAGKLGHKMVTPP